MRERPILFSGPMVQALLAGRKTQTRRIIKRQPVEWTDEFNGIKRYGGASDPYLPTLEQYVAKCPYGIPGDRLWVRETWCDIAYEGGGTRVAYKATPELLDSLGSPLRWLPSIHMPRWASRITLEITDVRVQRLQDISEEDAVAEGCAAKPMTASEASSFGADGTWTAKLAYAMLWDDIHGKGAWHANPFVWALTFRRSEAA